MQGDTMPSRSYSDVAKKARVKWSPEAHEIAAVLGEQLDAEVSDQIALGHDLTAARSSAHLTQPQLAVLSGIQQADISRIERGLGNPTRDTLLKLAGALNARLTFVPKHQDEAPQS
ncbi:XRE family transcriptional regulator [Arthrobacter sp. AFG7.2]|nr:XRE family transcriptional regulator [Arthrobacter sp. AFG7.2]